MIKVLLTLLLLFASVWLGIQLHDDPGYVLIVLRHWSIESTVWIATAAMLLAFILLHLLFLSFGKITHFPKAFHHWASRRRALRAHNKTTQGLIAFSEGYWKAAKSHLIEALPNTETPLINYLIAARAAQELGDTKLRDNYLREAQQSMPDAKIAVELTQAQLQLAHHQWEQALATLRHLHDLAPRHPYVLKLLARLYESIHDWQHVITLLPELTRNHALSTNDLQALTYRAYEGALQHHVQHHTWDALDDLMNQLPKSLKYNPILIAAYARALITQHENTRAEACLRRALQKNVDAILLDAYSELDAQTSRLSTIESLLKHHAHAAALQRCLAKLYYTQKLWGKAQVHLEQSLELEASPETYRLLGELLETLGNTSGAFDAYKNGLEQALAVHK
jgi:HemY protein